MSNPRIAIVSHNIECNFSGGAIDGSVIETFAGETVTFRPLSHAITSVTVNGTPIEPSGTTYEFTPSTDGLHSIQIDFAHGMRTTLKIVRLTSDWLGRMRFLDVSTKGEFLAKARLVARSMIRHRVPTNGAFPDNGSPRDHGASVSPSARTYAELPA